MMLERASRIADKVRKHGLKGSLGKLLEKLKKAVGVYWRFGRLVMAPACRGRRILGIWDYMALPWSIGDPLVFVEMLSVLKLETGAEAVDICIVCDREAPNGIRSKPGQDIVTPENVPDYALEHLPLFSTSPYLGSVFQFLSRDEFHSFLKNNLQRYDIFPPLGRHLAGTYNFIGGCTDFLEIQKFHKKHGHVPYLRVGQRDMAWANWFYTTHLGKNAIPVTLTLRRSRDFDERNADIKVWMDFLDRCGTVFPNVTFVVAGLREEARDDLRTRPNVILSKDHGTSVMEDLALIRASLLYMGTNSGVNTIALFSDLPYLIFQFPADKLHTVGFKTGKNFSFATANQKVFTTDIMVTPDLLFEEFKGVYSSLDIAGWHETAFRSARNKHTHPSSKV